MSLNYDATKIEHWELKASLPHTQFIIFATTAIGMGEITEKNYQEFYDRLALFQVVSETPRAERVDLNDVKVLIGLQTNVFPLWRKGIFLRRMGVLALECMRYQDYRENQPGS